jgi:hypothetical protein
VRWLAIISLFVILSGCVRTVEVVREVRVPVDPAPSDADEVDRLIDDLLSICIIPQTGD